MKKLDPVLNSPCPLLTLRGGNSHFQQGETEALQVLIFSPCRWFVFC